MSVIYKSLKKLRTPVDFETDPDAATSSHRVIAFKTAGSFVALLALVCLLGVIAGAWYFWDRNIQLEQRPVKDAQAALRNVGAAYAPAEAVQQAGSDKAGISESQMRFDPSNQVVTAANEKTNLAIEQQRLHSTPTADSPVPLQSTRFDRFAPQGIKDSSLKQSTAHSSALPDSVSRSPRKNATLAGANPQMTEQIRSEALEKSRRIGQLVRQIDGAIAAGNERRTEALVRELVTLKGAENPYVLKLRAYWHVHKQEYSSASILLKKVLAADPSDLEANINLAVVEINTDRLPQAEQRLLTLKEQFPENAQVSELLQQLR